MKHVLRKRDQTVAKFRQCGANKYAKTTMKFGMECLKTFDQALVLYKKNVNTLWADAIAKKMNK